MNYILEIMICGSIAISEILLIILLAGLIQGIVYKLTGFNIIKNIIKGLNKLDKKLNSIF